MRFLFYFILFFNFSFLHGQSKSFKVEWSEDKDLVVSGKSFLIPKAENFNENLVIGQEFKLVNQWEEFNDINEESVEIYNIKYSNFNISLYPVLSNIPFKNKIEVKLKTSKSRGKSISYLEFSPIVKINDNYKIVESFSVKYSYDNTKSTSVIQPQNSEMATGSWYRIFIDQTGIYKMDKSFLDQLGINTNSIDPRKIRIFGHGGEMLPMNNTENFMLDPIENAIQVRGEEDGVFDSDDHIIFFAKGPDNYNSESDTHLNLYEEKTSYFLSIGSVNGLRVDNYVEPSEQVDLIIDNYTNYQFHEIDEYNIAQIGRRWFGDRFDFESNKTFSFTFDNLIVSDPIDFKVSAAATSEVSTSMSININGSNASTLYFGSIGDPILASGANYNSEIYSNSSTINVSLNYNNSGNPASTAFLDYISMEATCDLIYDGEQLIFYNNNINSFPLVVEYQIGSDQNIYNIWDVSDISDISEVSNSIENNFSFKSYFSSENKFIAFSESNFLIPTSESNSFVDNQNIKQTIFSNSQGNPSAPDYVIIARQDMLFQAERLAQINREKNNLNVKVIELQKIYNEFGSGNQDISAIRNFIRYIYLNQNSGNNLKYLCLFGDASFDYKQRIPNNTNIIPSWLSLNSFSLSSSFISDDYYGMMDPNEGTMSNSDKLDIAVGRILADNYQRSVALVDKIESYYSSESFGDWRNKVIVISDDVDEPWENIIQSTSNEIADLISENKPFINTKKILIDSYEQQTSSGGERYPEVNSEILNGIKEGAIVINYFGHGGEDGIARERIFDKINAAAVKNPNRLNCFVSVTCEFTKFDNPNRETAGEFLYWNNDGGSIALITTTRQIFVSVGVEFNITLEQYLFSFGSDNYPSIAESLRLTKNDPAISSTNQRRLVFFIGDPAMKLAIPEKEIRISKINGVDTNNFQEPIRGLDLVNIEGQVFDKNGQFLDDYSGILTSTVYDKNISRTTLANDNTADGNGNLILLDFETLGEVLFRGKSSVENGEFQFSFVVPKDVKMEIDSGKFSFYAKDQYSVLDKSGYNTTIQIGGINEDAEEDNIGPEIQIFLNDESFVSGGITNESPNLIVKLSDNNGINTSSGVGHDILATIDSDDINTIILNNYYVADVDDYKNGTVNYQLDNLQPGQHTLKIKAWDVYNNSSISEIDFMVFNENEKLVLDKVLNYPNPFVDFTEFWFNHNSSSVLNVKIEIFTISGRLVKTITGNTNFSGDSNFSRELIWDGRDDFGDKVAKGIYVYKLSVRSELTNMQTSKIEKLVIL
jgi:hypothetical protein